MFLWAPQVVGGAAQEIFWGEYHKGRGWAGGVMGTEQRPVMMEVDAAVKRSATKRMWEKVRLAVGTAEWWQRCRRAARRRTRLGSGSLRSVGSQSDGALAVKCAPEDRRLFQDANNTGAAGGLHG